MDKNFDNGLDVFASYTNTNAESGWVATSSQLSSNLENMVTTDRMNVGVGKTPWAIEHRLVAGLNYTLHTGLIMRQLSSHYFIKYIQVKRFSYTLDGFNDGYSEYNTLIVCTNCQGP